MPKIYVILGVSNAGKDTLANALSTLNPNAVNVKFTAPMKQMLEALYGLPEGSLNDKGFRVLPAPIDPPGTWADLMIRGFKHLRAMDKNMMLQRVSRDLETLLAKGFDVLLTDTRTLEEANHLISLTKTYEICTVWVERPGVKPKSVDSQIPTLRALLQQHAKKSYVFINNQGISKATRIAKEILGNYENTAA